MNNTLTTISRHQVAQSGLDLVEKQIDQLDAEIGKLIEADTTTARRRDILRSIPGLGQVASAAILTFLPEI